MGTTISIDDDVLDTVKALASQPRCPNPLGTCAQVRNWLKRFVEKVKPGFCVKDISLLDDKVLERADELTPARVGDLYLLALAVANGAKFDTFERRIPADAVAGGAEALEQIPVL